LIDATPLEPAPHDPIPQYHEIAAEARMSEPPPAAAMIDISDLDGEDLACLGMRRAFQDDFFSDLKKQAGEEYFASLPKPREPPEPPKPPTLASVAKQANKPGVARIEMKPDGTVVIITGKLEPAAPENPWPLDEFRTKETKQ